MKKKIVISLMTLLLLGGVTLSVQAASNEEAVTNNEADYDSNGAVGFVGKYVFPDEEPEEETPKPGVVEPEEKPSPPPVPPQKPGLTLPQTGEKGPTMLSNIGVILAALTASSIYITKKREKEES